MDKEESRIKRSSRLQKEENAINKQVAIAKMNTSHDAYLRQDVTQPHRFAKHKAMDCGNPKCYGCGNPRKTHKDKLTIQEKRLFQNIEDDTNNESPIE